MYRYRSLSQDNQPALPVRLQVHLQHLYRNTRLMILRPGPAITRRDSTSIPVLGNQLRELPEWLEEFTDSLEDEGVLASRDTPANTSHDSDLERLAKVVSRKHSIFTHFQKNRNCEACRRTKIKRAPCMKRTGSAVLRAQITKFSVKDVNLETTTDTQSWHKIWQLNMDTIISVCNKNFSQDGKKFTKVSRAAGKAKSYCYLRNVQELLSDGTTPCEGRFREPSRGPVNPFGSMIENHLISDKDQ